MNAVEWNRDLSRPIDEIRQREAGMTDRPDRGRGTVSFDELRRGGVGVVVATQIARYVKRSNRLPGWHSPEQAWAMTQAQLAWYREMERARRDARDRDARGAGRARRGMGGGSRSAGGAPAHRLRAQPRGRRLAGDARPRRARLARRPSRHRPGALRAGHLRARHRRHRRHRRRRPVAAEGDGAPRASSSTPRICATTASGRRSTPLAGASGPATTTAARWCRTTASSATTRFARWPPAAP